MFKNYLTVAVRHLRRGKAFTVINGAGLALGMAACLLILLYLQDELSYDRHHDNADRIFRVTQAEIVATPPPLLLPVGARPRCRPNWPPRCA